MCIHTYRKASKTKLTQPSTVVRPLPRVTGHAKQVQVYGGIPQAGRQAGIKNGVRQACDHTASANFGSRAHPSLIKCSHLHPPV
jgi:hypothetical protein